MSPGSVGWGETENGETQVGKAAHCIISPLRSYRPHLDARVLLQAVDPSGKQSSIPMPHLLPLPRW